MCIDVAIFLDVAAYLGLILLRVLVVRVHGCLLLEVLESWPHLQSLLQVVERGVLQARVAYEVVELVARFDDVQVQNVIKTHDILLLQNSNIPVDIQVLKVLFPAVKADDAHDVAKNLLKRCSLTTVLVGAIESALDDNRVEVGEDFVFFKDHGARPRAIVDGEVKDPLMRRGLPDIV
eukprot:CAMPEP_0170475212 /NCGR_PEP_ID=MMETSP0123-20130129/16904_1 /TAXON_ID=182087 /ORGANISM="Favella ehrenbergii, Strain Fehren 1" /LENGTH=177 /DNA_ID=CAMNT_0010745579 /DNA_START=1907 /DNA_END=2440 /DNA_ORIENTATION=+